MQPQGNGLFLGTWQTGSLVRSAGQAGRLVETRSRQGRTGCRRVRRQP